MRSASAVLLALEKYASLEVEVDTIMDAHV